MHFIVTSFSGTERDGLDLLVISANSFKGFT